MSAIKLPPLPEPVEIDRHIPTNIVIRGYTADQLRADRLAVARAVIEACAEKCADACALVPFCRCADTIHQLKIEGETR